MDWIAGKHNAITDVPGIRVGQWTGRRAGTGCTVLLCEESQFVAVDSRGGAPGTRETDALGGANVVRKSHAIVLSGGSAFGLAAADGVMRWCAEHDVGFPTTVRRVPIVSAAVLFDLSVGSATAFPDEAAGYTAASRARAGRVAEGCVGAGTGATVCKLLGPERALKAGMGTASVVGPRGIVVGALAATNAAGLIYDPETGAQVAGPREDGGGFVGLAESVQRRTARMEALLENTTLVCVATNATLDHHQLQRLAIHAHDGLARTVLPAHTFSDGDTVFAIGMGGIEPQPDDALIAGVLAMRAVEQAILRSVRLAKGTKRLPSAGEWGSARPGA
ncbi:MAG: peptidase S58 [Anaerolinea sp.]|nr:peptidase S58 [Anaerolinea sp.]